MITSTTSSPNYLHPVGPGESAQHHRAVNGQFETLVQSPTGRELTIRRYDTGAVEVDLKRPDIDRLILSGGGAKGVAYSGMVKAMEEHQLLDKIESIYGSSAGAITAALLASGMGHADFDKLSDELDLVKLLDSENSFVKTLQSCMSTLGKQIAKIPGKAGSLGKSLADLLLRLDSKAMPLETLIRDKTVESIKAQYHKALADPQPQISEASKKCFEEMVARGYVTFADTETLSRDIPEIKQLHITGTAMFEGRPQLVVFNASLTPDMDIAVSAHVSASLPIVFQSPSVQGLPFQIYEEGERTSFKDGGIMLNTPVLNLFDPEFPMSVIPEREPLILKFQSEKGGKKNDRGTLVSALIDKFVGAPHSARDAQDANRIMAYEKCIVTVPLKTSEGDFTGTINGTVNFSMPAHIKNHLQEETEIEVDMHLAIRKQHAETYKFESLDEALLALDDPLFDESRVALKDDQPSQDIITFRPLAQEELVILQSAVNAANHSMGGSLQLTTATFNAIATLDQLCDTPAKTEWMAKRLNHGNIPELMQLLQVVRSMDKGSAGPKSPVMTKAIEEMSVREVVTKSENFMREVIFPSLYRLNQPSSNVNLLNQAIADLCNAKDPESYNAVLNRIADDYVSRNFPKSSQPFKSTTVNQARAWLIPGPKN
jgi:exoenzyme U